MSGEVRTCPECGTPAGQDGGPAACGCEADGFGPLRLRPYVTLAEPSQPPPPRAPDPYAHPPLPPEQPPPASAGQDDGDDGDDEGPEKAPRGAPVLLLAAVAGVLSVAALVTVLISSGDGDTSTSAREASVPLTAASAPPAPRPSGSTPTRHTSGPPSSPAPGTASAPAAAPPASATPGRTPTPTHSAPDDPPPPTTSPTPSPSASRHTHDPRETVLRRGDRGPEVTELQYRLRQLNLYPDNPDGTFDTRTEYAVRAYQSARGIQDDTPGTYGPATRRALESETRRGGDGWGR